MHRTEDSPRKLAKVATHVLYFLLSIIALKFTNQTSRNTQLTQTGEDVIKLLHTNVFRAVPSGENTYRASVYAIEIARNIIINHVVIAFQGCPSRARFSKTLPQLARRTQKTPRQSALSIAFAARYLI